MSRLKALSGLQERGLPLAEGARSECDEITHSSLSAELTILTLEQAVSRGVEVHGPTERA